MIRIGIPIQITAVVPVEIDAPELEQIEAIDRVDDWIIADGSEHQTAILEALKKAADDDTYQDTLKLLTMVAAEIAAWNKGVSCYYTPCAGLKSEQKING